MKYDDALLSQIYTAGTNGVAITVRYKTLKARMLEVIEESDNVGNFSESNWAAVLTKVMLQGSSRTFTLFRWLRRCIRFKR